MEGISILNSIKSATARSMSHSLYVNAKYNSLLSGSFNNADVESHEATSFDMRGIKCGEAKCWETYSEAEMSGEMCIEEDVD